MKVNGKRMNNGICHFDTADVDKRSAELERIISPTNEWSDFKEIGGGDVESKLG